VVVHLNDLTEESKQCLRTFELIWKEVKHPTPFSSRGKTFSKESPTSFSVYQIEQKDHHTFSILWNDGEIFDYRLSDLQRCCPCARCTDEMTGKRLVNARSIRDDLKAKRIVSVGRYALRIEFTFGCSLGIYGFDMLRKNECLPAGYTQ